MEYWLMTKKLISLGSESVILPYQSKKLTVSENLRQLRNQWGRGGIELSAVRNLATNVISRGAKQSGIPRQGGSSSSMLAKGRGLRLIASKEGRL
jgi:hypothetical protein